MLREEDVETFWKDGVVCLRDVVPAAWTERLAAGSLAIGLLLVAIAYVLSVETKSLLIGEAASPRQVEEIERALASSDDVQRVIHLRTHHVGPDEILVAAKVAFPADLTMRRLAVVIDEAEKRVRAAVPAARWIFLEPDVDRGEPR